MGEIAYIIESSIFVKKVEVVKVTLGFVTINYTKGDGGFRVRESRLFKTKAEAEENVKKVV